MSAQNRRVIWLLTVMVVGCAPLDVGVMLSVGSVAVENVRSSAWPWLIAMALVAGFAWAKFLDACR